MLETSYVQQVAGLETHGQALYELSTQPDKEEHEDLMAKTATNLSKRATTLEEMKRKKLYYLVESLTEETPRRRPRRRGRRGGRGSGTTNINHGDGEQGLKLILGFCGHPTDGSDTKVQLRKEYPEPVSLFTICMVEQGAGIQLF